MSTRDYDTDFYAWTQAQADALRAKDWAAVDLEHVIEEIADLGKEQRHAVESHLRILLAHLLKWRYQREGRSGSWRGTVEVQRQELAELLESGVLRNHATQVLGKAYANGVRQAVAETGLPEATFPADCPYTLDAVLSEPLEAGPA